MSHRQQRPAARIVDDLVVYDYGKGGKTALRPFMVETFKDAFRLQEEAKAKNSRRVKDILKEISNLEAEIS